VTSGLTFKKVGMDYSSKKEVKDGENNN